MSNKEVTMNENSISALKGAERVRRRPGVMLGSSDINGAFHTVIEILGNALDEARTTPNVAIKVCYNADNGEVTVQDTGRGVPMGWNEREQAYNWHLIFNEMFAGGKMETTDLYKYPIGLNGLGAVATQYTSAYFDVTSRYGGTEYKMHFEKGCPIGELATRSLEASEDGHGTVITWKPDDSIFSDTAFPHSMFETLCEEQAYINSVKIIFEYTVEEKTKTRIFEGTSLEEYLKLKIGAEMVQSTASYHTEITGKTFADGKNIDYRAECSVVLGYLADECRSTQYFYHNTARMKTGDHLIAVAGALREFFRGLGKTMNLDIKESDYEPLLGVLVSSYSTHTSFANQTKNGINNDFMYSMMYKAVLNMLNAAQARNDADFKALVERITFMAEMRKQAEQARQQLRLAKKSGSSKTPEKLADCRSKKLEERELYIVEGDSALGAVKQARDSYFQAVIPIRGKILNCIKASMDRIMTSTVIQDIVSACGTGIDIPDGEGGTLFNIDARKYDKFIICTDADVDGYQIRVLVYGLFYTLMPELLRQGKVYIAETPLFEIETNKGTEFALTLEDRDRILKELDAKGIAVRAIHRSKGLGENDPEMMSLTTMKPETRTLIPLNIDSRDEYVGAFTDMLFGNDIGQLRKGYILAMLAEGLKALAEEEAAEVVPDGVGA